ncbi:hypothetical protein MKW92_017884 [Papaver armeniacum]|nr:hypothetical protein MKW92_017884 [Papaver armeniacum]
MFWRMTVLSASSPVESVLDKEDFTLEELQDEEERAQVEQLLFEEAPEDAESNRVFKFSFMACGVFTCEIDVILKTLVEDEELCFRHFYSSGNLSLLIDLLFSFLEPNHPHSSLLAGYFSKVVVCLMLRKTVSLMNYVQAHQDVFWQLVDLIGITSIMEVLIRLVGADDHIYPNFMDVMEWLANSNLLEMIVDKLNPSSSPEVHHNTAETLCAITHNAPSALSVKLSSPSFVERIFGHALEDTQSKSGLVDSLSVCISLLDSKRATYSPLVHSIRSKHLYEPQIPINPETVSAMLPKLGDLLKLLNVCSDSKVLPTTYGELKPPLGKHRLKIVEFIAVLLRSGNEIAEKDFESIILSCLESKDNTVVDHLLKDCDVVGKIPQADQSPILSGDSDQPTSCSAGKQVPRTGNFGHITRISNSLIQLGNGNSHIQAYLQENNEWISWQTSILQERNNVENVSRWACRSFQHNNMMDNNTMDTEELFYWFAFQDDGIHSDLSSTSEEKLDKVNLTGANGGSISSDDRCTPISADETSGSRTSFSNEASDNTATNGVDNIDPKPWDEKSSTPGPSSNILSSSSSSSSPIVSSNGQLGTCPNEATSGIVDGAGLLKKHLTPNAGRENENMDKDGLRN